MKGKNEKTTQKKTGKREKRRQHSYHIMSHVHVLRCANMILRCTSSTCGMIPLQQANFEGGGGWRRRSIAQQTHQHGVLLVPLSSCDHGLRCSDELM